MKRLPLIVVALALMIATLFCALPQADACDQFQRIIVPQQIQAFSGYGFQQFQQQIIVPQRFAVQPVVAIHQPFAVQRVVVPQRAIIRQRVIVPRQRSVQRIIVR